MYCSIALRSRLILFMQARLDNVGKLCSVAEQTYPSVYSIIYVYSPWNVEWYPNVSLLYIEVSEDLTECSHQSKVVTLSAVYTYYYLRNDLNW